MTNEEAEFYRLCAENPNEYRALNTNVRADEHTVIADTLRFLPGIGVFRGWSEEYDAHPGEPYPAEGAM